MYPLYFTYEERWFDQRPLAFQEALEVFSGIEWCLPRGALSEEFYRARMRQATSEGMSLVFHLPHHLLDEGLSLDLFGDLKGAIQSEDLLKDYMHYYLAISEALRALGPIATRVRVIHHPLKSGLTDTELLMNDLYHRFYSYGLLPVLEPTLDSPDITAIEHLAQRWEQRTGQRLLCLDIRYLAQLNWDNKTVYERLVPHCNYGHFHSPEKPHCAPEQLTPVHVAWLTELATQGVPINIELLLCAYETNPNALQGTLNLIAPRLV